MEYVLGILIALISIAILIAAVASNYNDNNFYHFHYSEIPEGYYRHDMVGMYYRGITPENFGVYEGYAIAQKNNQYDPYAIAIYRSWDNKHVGYLPAGNAELHRILTYRGGKANAIFRIQGSRKRCYGDVYIEEKYKVFRVGNVLRPYLSRCVKNFPINIYSNHEGRLKCYLTTKFSKDEYDYTVTAIDYNNVPIGGTDDNQLQLFDYINKKGDMVPACCYIAPFQKEGSLFVPLNYTEKTINKKIEEFLNS